MCHVYYRIAYQRQAQSPQEMSSPESLVGYYQYQYGSGKKMGVFYRDEQGCTKVHSLLVKEGTIDEEYERSQERCFGSQLRGVPELVLDCALSLDPPKHLSWLLSCSSSTGDVKPIYVVNCIHFGRAIIFREGMEDKYMIRYKKIGIAHIRLDFAPLLIMV